MDVPQHPDVVEKFKSYPQGIREKLLFLRQLILETAKETDDAGEVEETLKWGEPSYLVKGGSTVRIDWKKSSPGQYVMFFNCNAKLVDTFKTLYREKLHFEGNRAIVFCNDDVVPVEELKHCIALALRYHQIKHLPMLGA